MFKTTTCLLILVTLLLLSTGFGPTHTHDTVHQHEQFEIFGLKQALRDKAEQRHDHGNPAGHFHYQFHTHY